MVSVCIDITQFGIAVVYLILSAKNISDFIDAFFKIEVSFCYVILAVGICLLPVTFLKSPQDFWYVRFLLFNIYKQINNLIQIKIFLY